MNADANFMNWVERCIGSELGERESLKKLVSEGYLDPKMDHVEGHVLYFPTKKAWQLAEKFGAKVCYECLEDPPIKSIRHSIAIMNMRIIFEIIGFPIWYAQRRCQHKQAAKVLNPDAILSIGQAKLAIELLLADEELEKYKRDFQFYEDSCDTNAVLYLVAYPELKRTLVELAGKCCRIYFVELEDFVVRREKAKIVGTALTKPASLVDVFGFIKSMAESLN